jgi:hypothetical protein
MFDNVTLDSVDIDGLYPIKIATKNGYLTSLTEYGQNIHNKDAKCVIFPKGKTTWEGFVPPCKFKDGDILSYQCRSLKKRTIYIYRHNKVMNTSYYVALSGDIDSTFMINDNEEWTLNGYNDTARLASEEEKQKLFKAIKDNGYRWNEETKTLEKEENKDKFDISTLNPFDKVLTRDNDSQKWGAELFSFYDNESEDYRFQLVGIVYARYCIPFVGNEHLLGTTNDCDEYYKTWE